MSRVFPRAEDLNQEELDFELQIRNQPGEVFELDLNAKQRHLRNLFKNDQKDGHSYRSPYNIVGEYPHIEGRILNLEKALEKRVESKYESRVLHYWYRVKWIQVNGEEEKRKKRELVQMIEKVMSRYQFGPPQSPLVSQINTIIQGNLDQASGGHMQTRNSKLSLQLPVHSPSVVEQGRGSPGGDIPMGPKGAIPKVPLTMNGGQNTVVETSPNGPQGNTTDPSTHISVPREEWEEMRAIIADLTRKLAQKESHGSRDNPSVRVSNREPLQDEPAAQVRRADGGSRAAFNYHGSVDEEDSEDDQRWPRQGWGRRVPQTGGRESDYSYGGSWNYGANEGRMRGQFGRYAGQGRVEKWKLRFTGEPRSAMTVENFLYKAKKLAEREGVTKGILLRDVHMLLEGAASDWFFTFVDDLITWEAFETSISYRFGNPNKDQGIRSKIHERKQLRGEPFIAFVTEIEKLNRLLSKPLSNRRKFEVIWDNMRQHYRSKISIVEVNDLQQLTKLNYRIDAADPQLQFQNTEGTSGFQRHHLDAGGSDYDSDQSVNAINTRVNRSFPQATRQTAEQPTRTTQNSSTALNCWNCQGQGHGWRQCSRPKVVFCYGCGNLGRTIRSCERCANSSHAAAINQGNE